jgi:hypothetical protein
MKAYGKFMVWLAMALLAIPATGCATGGSTRLSGSAMDKIIENMTTKDEVAELLGHPQSIMFFDRQGLCDYMYRRTLKRVPAHMVPKDDYEVWTYPQYAGQSLEEINAKTIAAAINSLGLKRTGPEKRLTGDRSSITLRVPVQGGHVDLKFGVKMTPEGGKLVPPEKLSSATTENALLIFNSDGVCVKKIYAKE